MLAVLTKRGAIGELCPLRPSGTSPNTSVGGGFLFQQRFCPTLGDPSTKSLNAILPPAPLRMTAPYNLLLITYYL